MVAPGETAERQHPACRSAPPGRCPLRPFGEWPGRQSRGACALPRRLAGGAPAIRLRRCAFASSRMARNRVSRSDEYRPRTCSSAGSARYFGIRLRNEARAFAFLEPLAAEQPLGHGARIGPVLVDVAQQPLRVPAVESGREGPGVMLLEPHPVPAPVAPLAEEGQPLHGQPGPDGLAPHPVAAFVHKPVPYRQRFALRLFRAVRPSVLSARALSGTTPRTRCRHSRRMPRLLR